MDKVKEVAEGLKKDFHPFIIVATTNDLPVAYYLSVYDAIFKFETFVGALDVLFQTLFALHISYPDELLSFFNFMQIFFYRINTGNDRTFTRVIKLMKTLDFTRIPK